MKKIIIAMCGLLIAGEALAHPDNYSTPNKKGYSGWGITNTYTTDIGNTLYSKLSSHIGNVDSSKRGTYSDEGAIVLIVARDIYENGGYFCPTQIQAANKNGKRYTWLDYYNPEGAVTCEKLCKPGFYGEKCSKSGRPTACNINEINFGDNFDSNSVKTYGEHTGAFTNVMNVFTYNNSVKSSETRAWHNLLGVTQILAHGVIVSPIRIEAERYQSGTGDGKYSRINSVKTSGKEFILCADGYEPNPSQTDCQEPSWCATQNALDHLCTGTANEYESESHKLIEQTNDNGKGCWVIRCQFEGYGFKNSTDKTCELCGTDLRSGVQKSTGICITCPIGQCLNDGECGTCTEVPKLKIERGPNYDSQNRECWRQTSAAKFWGCVMCPDPDEKKQCYNKNSSGKYECGTCPTE